MPVTPKSSPKKSLKGYDARNREIGTAKGGTVTATLLKRPGKHVPTDKGWIRTPDNFFKRTSQ